MGAVAAAEKDVMNNTDDNLLAVADAMMQDMEHAGLGDENATGSPFAALDAIIGSLQEGETDEKGHADGNPFAGLEALAGTMGVGEAGGRPVESQSPFAIAGALAGPVGQTEQ